MEESLRNKILKRYCLNNVAPKKGKRLFINKMKRNDFKESELQKIADALGYRLEIRFVDKETGEQI